MDAQNDELTGADELSSCPTFSSYSNNNNLASIALRVADEFTGEVDQILIEDNKIDDDDFEFSIDRDDDPSDLFFDGEIQTVYPIFSRDIQNQPHGDNVDVIDFEIGVPLRRLLIEEREQRRDVVYSSSSEEDEEIANIPAGTYCVWKPKKAAAAKDLSSPNMCNKSNSTGSTSSSKRWKIMDLLRRSNSEGNENYLYLAPKHKPEKFPEKIDHHQRRRRPQGSKTQALVTVPRRAGESNARVKKLTKTAAAVVATPSAHETFYVRNRAIKESEKRKSYMPQVLVGVFANVNAFTRTYPPF